MAACARRRSACGETRKEADYEPYPLIGPPKLANPDRNRSLIEGHEEKKTTCNGRRQAKQAREVPVYPGRRGEKGVGRKISMISR